MYMQFELNELFLFDIASAAIEFYINVNKMDANLLSNAKT